MGLVFDRYDDLGTDGNRHAEVCHDGRPGVGIDGARHVPVDTATPHRWHVA